MTQAELEPRALAGGVKICFPTCLLNCHLPLGVSVAATHETDGLCCRNGFGSTLVQFEYISCERLLVSDWWNVVVNFKILRQCRLCKVAARSIAKLLHAVLQRFQRRVYLGLIHQKENNFV